MSKKRMEFPMEVPKGSVTVKIYKVRNKAYIVTTKRNEVVEKDRFSFMISFFADGKRRQQMFADFDEALEAAKEKADKLASGQLDAINLGNKESSVYTH